MIGITLGDPAGIGPEIVLKALSSIAARPRTKVLLIGARSALLRSAGTTGQRPAIARLERIPFLDVGLAPAFRFGTAQKACGEVALRALEAGVCLLRQGAISGLVTAPVSKEALRRAGFRFPGQTEFLAARLGAKHYAMMAYAKGVRGQGSGAGDRPLRIAFVTIHKPIADVPAAITAPLVAEKIALLAGFLRRSERISSPRIAVLALNPHAYEFTRGEEARIARGIKLASEAQAEGPFPADSVGLLMTGYDGIVAMYHDQAMIPAKLLAQGRGVNVTLGLPYVRTSPLHGTAFDIAGKGIAEADSMRAAIELCLQLSAQPRLKP
jgi:4-hydroxythreonine-4-phosphate dehydrogenase